jgi:serine/threonine protein kinase
MEYQPSTPFFVRIPDGLVQERTGDSNMVQSCFVETDLIRHLGKQIARGAFGKTFSACPPDTKENCPYVAKVVELRTPLDEKNFRLECAMANHASENGYGPKVFHTILCNQNQGIIVMEKMDWTMNDLIEGKTFGECTLNDCIDALYTMVKMHEAGIWHTDLHSENFMYKVSQRGEREWKVIDFGLAWPLAARVTTSLALSDFLSWVSGVYIVKNKKGVVRSRAPFPLDLESFEDIMGRLKNDYAVNTDDYKRVYIQRVLDEENVDTTIPGCVYRMLDLYIDAANRVDPNMVSTIGIDVFLSRTNGVNCDRRFDEDDARNKVQEILTRRLNE